MTIKKFAGYFSPDYITARKRFCETSISCGYQHNSYPIDQIAPTSEMLSIDVSILNSTNPSRTVAISSGLHGVEGFLGSAIQLAFLEECRDLSLSLPSDVKIVLVHALNPYGFAWLRRWDQANIDLNRNFLLPGEVFEGSPKDYPKFNSFLNPTAPPSKFEPYTLQALWLIFRYGMASLRNTLPVGQYDFQKGLFFGGHAPSKTQEILSENLAQWIGEVSEVIHVDFHTGLGYWGAYKLLLADSATSESHAKLTPLFGADAIEPFNPEGVSYPIRGGLGSWCQALLPKCHYELLTAEFGTYPTIQVLQALRSENRAYWWGKSSQNYAWTKEQLVEMFAPRSENWRNECVIQGLKICKQALGKS
jgi:hypothetical protein